MPDAMHATVRRLRLVAAMFLLTLAAVAATPAGASAADPADPPVCGVTGPKVCVDVDGSSPTVSPTTVSPLTGLVFPAYVSYKVTITNESQSTVTHAVLRNIVPPGSTPSTPPTGCTSASGVVTCAFGNLPSGGPPVTVTITVTAPQVEGLVTDKGQVTFDEGLADNPANPGKQDTVTATEDTTVKAVSGAAESLVPSDTLVQLDTDPTHVDVATPKDRNIGKAKVPASPHDPVTATLNEDNQTPFSCPKKQICRSGDWVHAVIPGTFLAPNELQFELHWSKLLVPKQQTLKNLAVFYLGDCVVTCPPLRVISARCSSQTPAPAELPCLFGVAETATDFRATLHSSTNGRMR